VSNNDTTGSDIEHRIDWSAADDTLIQPATPEFWAHISEDSTLEEIAAADATYDAWLMTPAGVKFLAWDRAVAEAANRLGLSYHEAMKEVRNGK
jgi:hypothetical protein